MCKEIDSIDEFIGYDLFGNKYNCKYPPDLAKNGNGFEGYASPNQLTFFHDFCIQQYGVAFYYGDVLYEAEFTEDGPILTNRMTGELQGPFEDAVKLLERSEINGDKMVNMIDQFDHVVLH